MSHIAGTAEASMTAAKHLGKKPSQCVIGTRTPCGLEEHWGAAGSVPKHCRCIF